jgi:thiamine biosynthesis lipoprotein
MSGLTRRRFIAISAAAACASHPALAFAGASRPTIWRGIALGAKAEIRLDVDGNGDEGVDAADIIKACRAEIDRLESLFSLYRPDSAVARLNRSGRLAAPDADFLTLLSIARSVHRATGSAFDPTVQPLWDTFARIHTEFPDDVTARQKAISAAHDRLAGRIGFEAVTIAPDRIAFARPGMALTLNGIAQGFITDRIADLLRGRGLNHVLVDIGELRALDGRRDGSDWPVRIAEPGTGKASARTVRLNNRALATSEPLGTTFDAAGRFGHILDPRTGRPAAMRRQVSVEAPSAAIADALSTAFCLMPDHQVSRVLETFAGAKLAHVM